MTQDNEDAALKLAKECGVHEITLAAHPEKITNYYNAARKPLEEENARLSHIIAVQDIKDERLQQQLLATQEEVLRLSEAYQRVVEALRRIGHADTCTFFGSFGVCNCGFSEALANPPSLEAVERKKLDDEIAVLDSASKWTHPEAIITEMIAERKAKLEKMK